MRGPDCSALLLRALLASARAAGLSIAVEKACDTGWESATFTGARHVVTASAEPDDRFDGWIESLPEADLPMRGHLVADLVITAVERELARIRFTIEALTVAE